MTGDVASALSGNSIVGRKETGSEAVESKLESKMLLFNGLFYQGNWLWPFKTLQPEDKKYFNALSGKQDVKFMEATGTYKYVANFKNLAAVEIPYKVKSSHVCMIRNFEFFRFFPERTVLASDCNAEFRKWLAAILEELQLQIFEWNPGHTGANRNAYKSAQVQIRMHKSCREGSWKGI